MITVVTRAGSLAPLMRATATSVSSGALAPVNAVPVAASYSVPPPAQATTTTHSMSLVAPRGNVRASSGPAANSQVRFVHSDVKVPDYSHYRRAETMDPSKKNDTHESRNGFSYMIAGGGLIASVYGAKVFVTDLVMFMSPPANVLALAKIEVKVDAIPEGKSVTFKWRGKPLFVRHRTAAEIAQEEAVSLASLRDPETDAARVKDPKWLVVIGVCTHLGCIPIADAGDFGGFYCPCHGSHYDSSGRIRKGPAPLNLEVPPYEFNEDKTELVVG